MCLLYFFSNVENSWFGLASKLFGRISVCTKYEISAHSRPRKQKQSELELTSNSSLQFPPSWFRFLNSSSLQLTFSLKFTKSLEQLRCPNEVWHRFIFVFSLHEFVTISGFSYLYLSFWSKKEETQDMR